MDARHFDCACSSVEHFLRVTPDSDAPGGFVVEIVTTRGASGWRRFRELFAFLFNRHEVVIGDLILDAQTAAGLASFLSGRVA